MAKWPLPELHLWVLLATDQLIEDSVLQVAADVMIHSPRWDRGFFIFPGLLRFGADGRLPALQGAPGLCDLFLRRAPRESQEGLRV